MTTPQVLFILRTLILALHLILFSKMPPLRAIQHVLSTRSIQGNTSGSYLKHGCTLRRSGWRYAPLVLIFFFFSEWVSNVLTQIINMLHSLNDLPQIQVHTEMILCLIPILQQLQ